jgi:hypothetical protein
MKLPAVELRIAARAVDSIELARLAGSALRGAFGTAFRAMTCTTRKPTCAGCHLVSECAFPSFFGPSESRAPGVFPKQQDTPRRYAFDIVDTHRVVRPGNTFSFGLRIVGEIKPFLPWVALALLEIARRGLGKHRGRFLIERISAGQTLTCIASDGVMDLPSIDHVTSYDLLEGLEEATQSVETGSILIRFVHPTYLRAKGHDPFTAPPLVVVVRAALRRLSALALLFGAMPVGLPYSQLITATETAIVRSAELTAVRTSRYSLRQHRHFPMEGIVGAVCYDRAPLWTIPLLQRAGWMGIGRLATHGLGRVQAELCTSSS